MDRHALSQLRRHQRRRRRLRHAARPRLRRYRACARRSIRGPIRPTGICIAATSAISALSSIAAREVAEPQPGDVMVLRYGRCYSHGGIVTRTDAADDRARLSIRRAACSKRRSIATAQLSDPRAPPRFFSYWATERAWSGACFGERIGGSHDRHDAGLYRPADPDRGQHAADPDRLGRVEARAECRLVQRLSDHETAAARAAAARAACSRSGAVRSTTYSASVIMALVRRADRRHQSDLEGPVGLYAERDSGCRCSPARRRRATWSYLATAYPSQALAYQGTAYRVRAELQPGRHRDARQPQFRGPGACLATARGVERRRRRSGAGRQ